jgi:4-amino-4-deoxy-L-arabinose transferase-like glycosyltransferase
MDYRSLKIIPGGFVWFFFHSLMLGLVLLATWLRFWQIESIPPGLWFDEAYNGMDTIGMMVNRTWPVFFTGNNGREALYHYLLIFPITVFGNSTLTLRLAPIFIGIVSVPVMYRWILTLFNDRPDGRLLALVGTAGLATSFWFLLMNRTGYRANLLPLCVLMTSLLFWRGWQNGKLRFYLLAGVMLGVTQYSYFSARLLPLVFGLFVLTQTIFWQNDERLRLKLAWLGLVIMAVASAAIALPLLIYIFNDPGAGWGRALAVSVKLDNTNAGWSALGAHLLESVRVFVDGQDPNWRHHLVGIPMFDWLSTLGFWWGVAAAIWQFRQPVYRFLLILLVVMWLPAPLSTPAIHTLRLAGMLPAYYALMAVGLLELANWLGATLKRSGWPGPKFAGMLALTAVIFISGGLTIAHYFYRWGRLPEVYRAFDGPVVALADRLTDSHAEINTVIPYYLFTHASMRYLLYDSFTEKVLLPEEIVPKLSQQSRVQVFIPQYPPDDGKPPAWVWLQKKPGETGVAYVSAVNRLATVVKRSKLVAEIIDQDRNEVLGWYYSVDTAAVLPLFPQKLPAHSVAVDWYDKLRLVGYEFTPALVDSSQENKLYLAWQILGDYWITEKMFLQVVDSGGAPVGQQEIEPPSRKMYRWRADSMILELHPLNFVGKLSPGLYFVRLGFFDPDTGRRLPIFQPENRQPLGDEWVVGPLVVMKTGSNPLKPAQPIKATLGDGLELIGYTTNSMGAATEVTLYWQSAASVQADYTVFLQLLNPANQLVAQVDTQPLAGLYPTSRWQPGDIIPQRLVLPVPAKELAGNRLVTGMYDIATGLRLPAYDGQAQPFANQAIELSTLPAKQ